jgi:hypothetical protein
MDLVVCRSCGARFPVNALTEEDNRAIYAQRSYERLAEELRMLLKVQAYYRRYPQAEGKIKPDMIRLLDSDDPEVLEKLRAGVPLDQIEAPLEEPFPASGDAAEDAEVVEYLKHHSFSLGPRLEFVAKRVAELKNFARAAACPRAKRGGRYVPGGAWAQYPAPDAITWYWPEWHSVDRDGTLRVKTSGRQGGSHWSGETVIVPGKPEHAFWRWLVRQKKYHRLVEEGEIAAIQKERARKTRRPG